MPAPVSSEKPVPEGSGLVMFSAARGASISVILLGIKELHVKKAVL